MAKIKLWLLRWIFNTEDPPRISFGVPDVGIIYASQEVMDKLREKYGSWYKGIAKSPLDNKIIKEMTKECFNIIEPPQEEIINHANKMLQLLYMMSPYFLSVLRQAAKVYSRNDDTEIKKFVGWCEKLWGE